MTIPQINLNGTKASVLINGYLAAKDALDSAIEKLEETAPHGRDYARQDLFERASAEHNQRIGVLSQMRDDLYEIAMVIDGISNGV